MIQLPERALRNRLNLIEKSSKRLSKFGTFRGVARCPHWVRSAQQSGRANNLKAAQRWHDPWTILHPARNPRGHPFDESATQTRCQSKSKTVVMSRHLVTPPLQRP
jgi:hypothetical protein